MKFENIFKNISEEMRLALLSFWAPGTHVMRPAIEELLKREPLLAEPVFQSTFPWKNVDNEEWCNLFHNDVIRKLRIRERIPYTHQVESWKELKNGNSIAVTSGTGSGKTECFMYPVINDLYTEKLDNENQNVGAIQAIFLYPLNALMEDQKDRLSTLCESTGLRFGVYNGSTEYYNANEDPKPGEINTREKIRKRNTRPEILLTNPSMLEYILVRKEDQEMIKESRGKLRWIVIDEAHTYTGSAAVELSYLIKRILNAFDTDKENVRFACTSATIGGDEGVDNLKQFISSITGQDVDKISVIGGERVVPEIDRDSLQQNLANLGLKNVDDVLSLRKEINTLSGMSLTQIWERLYNSDFSTQNTIEALRIVDSLCEMRVEGLPLLSLRSHFFMRSISSMHACANPECSHANNVMPIYGYLTTNKLTVCPHCGAPMLEIVQCKPCGEYLLMGSTDEHTKVISPRVEDDYGDDYFTLEDNEEDNEDDIVGNSSVFFLAPYREEQFFNPIRNANWETVDIEYIQRKSYFRINQNKTGNWVEVLNNDRRNCPTCGSNAFDKGRLKFKHFRIPKDFLNNVISPILLSETATNGMHWGKYIAFTDSRQGTAISAKTFNINTERIQARSKLLEGLSQPPRVIINGSDININTLSEEIRQLVINQFGVTHTSLSLSEVADCIYDDLIFKHRSGNDNHIRAYKSALLRHMVGRKNLYEYSLESLGLIKLVYPALNNITVPDSIKIYCERYDCNIDDACWRTYLKIYLDYFFRLKNHINPFVDENEKKYIINTDKGEPVHEDQKPRVTDANIQSRIVTLLCYALKIDTVEILRERKESVNAILESAWEDLKRTGIITKVDINRREGYNYRGDARYEDCYYLDLSLDSNVCKVEMARDVWMCPVSHKLLDTTFCDISPYIKGELNSKLFERYRCNLHKINMPLRPNENVETWYENDENFSGLIDLCLWNNLYKYCYLRKSPYLAAEHSAQQSRERLRDYTEKFRRNELGLNVLHCSTTMEMGVDIGDIEIVLLDTVPPTAANYLQRVGRAGRKGQTKSLAISLCDNTPIGNGAFANPMWALQTVTQMSRVNESMTIIQRHINSFFFREFINRPNVQGGINAAITIDEFITDMYDSFVDFLNNVRNNQEYIYLYQSIFNTNYSVDTTMQMINDLYEDYTSTINTLNTALNVAVNSADVRKSRAISYQINKMRDINLLQYLSTHQFLPNANMPTDVVEFSYITQDELNNLKDLKEQYERKKQELSIETDEARKDILKEERNRIYNNIKFIYRNTSTSRDIYTALNEFAPEQTVVINERNYVSKGIKFKGVYSETQIKGIYYCRHCGHTNYDPLLEHNRNCPICGNPYHGVIDRNNTTYTLAYEPIGFSTVSSDSATREEKTSKRYYDIRPLLLNTNWESAANVNMCDIIKSEEGSNIIFYNLGTSYGFAFCKKCGRAAVEYTLGGNNNTIPSSIRAGHDCLLGGTCDATSNDIARNVVFTGKHSTCYSALRFKKNAGTNEYENDEELVYSLGVVLKRALAIHEGIDENEIDFGVKQETDVWVLFIYDKAKGGCGYSTRLYNTTICQEVFDLARKNLEEKTCRCHIDGGACYKCLLDRNSNRFANKLSKSKALNWLSRQRRQLREVPTNIRNFSPNAIVDYRSLKTILREAINDPEVKELSLFVSDNETMQITDWLSVKTEIGLLKTRAIQLGKEISLFVEYHPNKYIDCESAKLPLIGLKNKIQDLTDIVFIADMGEFKSGMIVKYNDDTILHYFTDTDELIGFSDMWGNESEDKNIYVDRCLRDYSRIDEPRISEGKIVLEAQTGISRFKVCNYFSNAILPYFKDIERLDDYIREKQVRIEFCDTFINTALSGLMLTYVIKELRDIYSFTITNIDMYCNTKRRKCEARQFNDYTYIHKNFRNSEDADTYILNLLESQLGIVPTMNDTNYHHRFLKLITSDGRIVELRFDHGVAGGYESSERYGQLVNLDGNVEVRREYDKTIIYYIIFHEYQG